MARFATVLRVCCFAAGCTPDAATIWFAFGGASYLHRGENNIPCVWGCEMEETAGVTLAILI